MGARILTLVGFALVLMVVVGLLSLAQVGLKGQTAAETQSDGSLRTPWREPDLQGIWTEEVDIPLQRPERYGNREFFTDEEYAEADNERARLLAGQTSGGGDRRSAPGSQNDVAGAYSNAHLSFKHLGRRTSLIVDPPNGRIPPLTAEAQALAADEREFQLALCALLRPAGVDWRLARAGSTTRLLHHDDLHFHRGTNCQWQPKTAHFGQLKTAHFGERAVGRRGRSPVDAHAPRRCGAGGHGATPSRRSSDADRSQC